MTPSDAFVPLPIGHADIKFALKKSKSPLLTPVALDARDLHRSWPAIALRAVGAA